MKTNSCHLRKAQCKHGFSLIGALISVAIVGMTIMAILSALSAQQKEQERVQRGLVRSAFVYDVLQILRNPENCFCQMGTKKIDTTKASLGSDGDRWTLDKLRNGCGGEIIAKPNLKLGDRVEIKSIEVSNIIETGTANEEGLINEYIGRLVFTYATDPRGGIYTLEPSVIPISFTIDPSSGAASARDILVCGSSYGGKERLDDFSERFLDQKEFIIRKTEDIDKDFEENYLEIMVDSLNTYILEPLLELSDENKKAIDGLILRVTYLEKKKEFFNKRDALVAALAQLASARASLASANAISCPCIPWSNCGTDKDGNTVCDSGCAPDHSCLNQKAAAIATATAAVQRAKAAADSAYVICESARGEMESSYSDVLLPAPSRPSPPAPPRPSPDNCPKPN